MNTRTVTEAQFELENTPAGDSSWQLLSFLAAIPAQFRNARRIERQAKQLYAMSDNELQEQGLSRERISERLLKIYSE